MFITFSFNISTGFVIATSWTDVNNDVWASKDKSHFTVAEAMSQIPEGYILVQKVEGATHCMFIYEKINFDK